MRIDEIASAEEQLALLRVIMDNTWKAVEQQAEEERKAQALQQAHAKLKARSSIGRKATASSAVPFKPVPNLPAPPLPKPTPSTASLAKAQSQASSNPNQVSSKASGFAKKTAKNSDQTQSLDEPSLYPKSTANGNDRLSQNGLRNLKK